MTKTKKLALVNDTYAIGIHGVTGQEIDEGTLEAGTLVRNMRLHRQTGFDSDCYRFEASTNGGKTWYTQETYGKPATREVK